MILHIILLLLVLSLEATIGLPIFFIYLSYKLISHRQEQFKILALFVISLLLAIFYSLSWPLLALLVFVFHLIWQNLISPNFLWKVLSFALFNLAIFVVGKLQFNYFYFIHIVIFAFYFYKTNLKHYAS